MSSWAKGYLRFLVACAAAYAALLAPLAACEDVVETTCVDGAACFTGENGPVLVEGREPCGVCRPGALDCSEEACVGEVLPSPEVCDGVDNDCDCETDEDLTLEPGHPDSPCEQCGLCAEAEARCIFGFYLCAQQPKGEECDSVDNDCDCEVDDIGVTYNYSGPVETLGVGECRPSIAACIDGTMRVTEQVLPEAVDACWDGKDNDCDGTVDENDTTAEPRSVALLIDLSGSMEDELDDLRQAVCLFAAQAQPGVFMSLIVIALGDAPYGVRLISDFDTPDAICALLYTSDAFGTASANEYQPDAFVMAANLTWPSLDRAAVVMSDETVQEGQYTIADVEAACILHGIRLYVASVFPFTDEWMASVTICGGDTTNLSNPYDLSDSLMEWFEPECLLD